MFFSGVLNVVRVRRLGCLLMLPLFGEDLLSLCSSNISTANCSLVDFLASSPFDSFSMRWSVFFAGNCLSGSWLTVPEVDTLSTIWLFLCDGDDNTVT